VARLIPGGYIAATGTDSAPYWQLERHGRMVAKLPTGKGSAVVAALLRLNPELDVVAPRKRADEALERERLSEG